MFGYGKPIFNFNYFKTELATTKYCKMKEIA